MPLLSYAAIDTPHNASSNMTCGSCHDSSLEDSPLLSGSDINNFCLANCHNDSTSGPYTNTSAPLVKTHRTKLCLDCHDPHVQGQKNWKSKYGSDFYLATGQITGYDCDDGGTSCQDKLDASQALVNPISTLTYSGGSFRSGWSTANIAEKTSSNRRPILLPNVGKLGWTFPVTAMDATTITVKGYVGTDSVYQFVSTPTTFGIIYGQYVRQKMDMDADSIYETPVRLFDKDGDYGFAYDESADGTDETADGICQVCHTTTNHWRGDGTLANDHYSGQNCTNACHKHTKGFSHTGGEGGGTGCDECHGHDDGFGGGTYYGTVQSHSTHTETDSDDVKGAGGLACSVCHNTAAFPFFAAGVDGNADGLYNLAETTVCDTCHSKGGTYDGIDDAVIGAKSIWDTGSYTGTASSTLRAGKEKWCATCHDETPSQIQSVNAPNIVGDEDEANTNNYPYAGIAPGWGYYKTGHGLPSASTYAASGGLTYGAGKDCVDCHDYSIAHIDGDARTYVAASDNYQAGYRLKSINGGEPMNIPHPTNIDDHDPGQYALCLSCHDSNKYLLKTPNPVTTSFRDDNDLGPWDGGTAPINVHEYHLAFNSVDYDSDWNGVNDSEIACTNCHNVHGSTYLSMIRDGKLVNRQPGMPTYYDNVMVSPDTADLNPPNPTSVTLNNSTGTVFLATSPGNICGHCHGGDWVKYYRSPPSAPVAPSLDWTGEANYVTDGVHPGSGTGGDYFTFRIEYTDANYQLPNPIQVWIDENDNSTYESGEKYDMQAVDSGDVDVSDGKIYRVIRQVGNVGDGTLSYRFHASDGVFDATDGAATGDPTHATANTMTVINNAPVLSWTNEDGYTADGVNPNSAAAGSTFTFRVKYTDPDNNAPSSIKVWVDKDDDGTSVGDEGTELITMVAADGGDTMYNDGKLYTKDVVIASAGDNTLSYNFSASDGTDTATGVPTSNRTVTVTTSNSAPTLDWTGEANYILDGVNPDSDVPDSTFTFRVKYADADNNAPSSIQLWIDKNDDGDYLDAQEKLDMTAVDADSDYTDGRLYTKDVTLATAGDGIMNYRFHANDGTDDATGTPANDSIVTVIIGAIKVSCPGVGDYDYTSIQTAINNATDGDTVVVADGTCTETIIIDNKDLTIKSVNGAASTIIDGNGAYPVVDIKNGADTTLNGFTVTGGNHADGLGSGISISASSPTIANSIITGNAGQRGTAIYATGSGSTVTITDSTVSSNTSSQEGPGIYLVSGVSAVITDTTVSGNTASNGGGGGLYMTTSANASLNITGSIFGNNSVPGYGGGISASASGGTVTIVIDNTTISGNSAQKGAGLYMTDGGAVTNLTITDSTISGNSTSEEYGGAYINAFDAVTINGTTVNNNSATNAGGLYLNGITTLTVSESTIKDNTCTGSNAGGIRVSGGTASFERSTISGNVTGQRGAGVHITGTTGITFTNCMILGNKSTSFDGAGLFFDGAGVTANVINSTFSGNKAGTTGGAISNDGASVTLKNSILYGNGGSGGNSEINGTVTASYSDIKQSGYEGNNNLNTDPSFVSSVHYSSAPTSSGNYHLNLSSPMIDMGTAAGAPTDDFDNNVRPIGGYDIGADEVITVVNNPPTLSWTAETNYTNDGVDPNLGTDGGNYVFRVNYADSNNNAPSSIQVWIDKNDDGDYLDGGEKIDMTAVDGGDSTYTDGKLYTKTEILNYSGDGAWNYRFYANDGYEIATGTPTSASTVIVNTAPTLAWLGSGNYTADGVDPNSAASGSNFDFRISYTDSNNDAPTAIQVWVDKNDDGDYLDSSEKLTMTQLDSGDTDYTDGKVYKKVEALSYAGNGDLNYRFYASDGSTATGDPTANSTVTVTNTAPTLGWLGSGNYVTDGVNPNGDTSGSNSFVFRINYTDADNQAPSSIEVWIDVNDNASHEGGEKYAMTEVDGGDTTYSDGKVYTYTATNLARVSDDYLNYRFAASDGIAAATGDPVSADKPVGVFTANQAPDLDWTGEANYITDGVNPESGAVDDTFIFRVKYTDLENTAPSSIQVWLDLNDDGDSTGEEGTELFTMTAVDGGDTSYDDGKLYTKDVVATSGGDGTLLYNFLASDGTDNATGNATANKTIGVLSPITVCPGGHADAPCDFTTIQGAISDAGTSSGDYIQVSGATYSENINFNGKNVNIFKKSGAGITTIQGSGGNSAVVTFNNSETASAILDGFTINNSGTSSATRGILITGGAAPTIKNTVITGNNADNAGADSATNCYGGGGACIVDSVPTFDNVTIKANSAANRNGCGMYIRGTAGGATIQNTVIGGTVTGDGNKCTNGKGGGIYFTGSTTGTLTISDTNIQYNQGQTDGGGIYLTTITNTTTITGSTILNNTQGGSSNGGGGIYANAAPLNISSGTTIADNFVGANDEGGGIYFAGSTLTISGSTINSNQAGIGNSGTGGGVYFNGTTLNMTKTNVRGNKSTNNGGGINIASGTANITNSIIAGNVIAVNDYKYGGGIANNGTLNLNFSTVTDNYVIRTGGGLYANGTENIYNSIIYGNNTGNGTPEIQGSVNVLYLTEIGGGVAFVTPNPATNGTPTMNGVYSLQSGSNCIDTGDAQISGNPTGAPNSDIEGNTRPTDIGGKGDGTDDYDKGAYEYQP